MNENQRSRLERLPNELKSIVVVYLGDAQSTMNPALTGPEFDSLVTSREVTIATTMVKSFIGSELMPIALARYHAAATSEQDAREESSKSPLYDPQLFFSSFRNGLAVSPSDRDIVMITEVQFTLKTARKILQLHSAINYYARSLAYRAMKFEPRLTKKLFRCVPEEMKSPSDKELTRFCKALYIFQLISDLFPFARGGELWNQFWLNFSPWENQQLRCLQLLLADHVDDVICADDEKRDEPQFPRNDGYTLTRFMINRGLIELKRLEKDGDVQATQEAVDRYGRQRARGCKEEAWHKGGDALWRYDVGPHVSLNVEHIFSAYADDDSGPRDIWLYTLAMMHSEDPMFRDSDDHMFRCDRCTSYWGFVFWDRAKLDWHTHRCYFPETSEMLEGIADLAVGRAQFRRWNRGREVAECRSDILDGC
ncbi:Uu.00g132960.m01.CDS01 [Anthostomella pinea]|uniref:Uu.00g132960.m01.CDS01 n=1 Tax=Anthostomella pinea TaxID=933095 RepID=A0AAI8YKD2_9PEZI|nr:Uu.00g132960.m01.CDS01 [Anthostomella pinea]